MKKERNKGARSLGDSAMAVCDLSPSEMQEVHGGIVVDIPGSEEKKPMQTGDKK